MAAFSSIRNFLIFSSLRLFSPTVLHATICISRGFGSGSGLRGFVSVTNARSFFLMTVFFGYQCLMLLCGENSLLLFHLVLFSIGVLKFPGVPVLYGPMFFALYFFYCKLR